MSIDASTSRSQIKHVFANVSRILTTSAHRTSHTFRYSSIPVLRKENVSEHTFMVSFYAYLLAKHIGKPGEIDYGVLLSRALCHDLDESNSGDFLRTIKYGYPGLKHALDEVSVIIMKKISEEVGQDLLDTWLSAKADDLEGDIIKLADLMQVAAYLMGELKFGNSHIIPQFEECKGHLRKLEDEVRDVVKPYVAGVLHCMHEFRYR